ncbi:MAG: type IV secretion system DNA-binding domain-containing protein [Christensenellaceae bacterium]|nr:type IV secretion system DNA-binding domain-containing protein [Christensenellaceae bacterium]
MSNHSSKSTEFKNKRKFPFAFFFSLLLFSSCVLVISFFMDQVLILLDIMTSNLFLSILIGVLILFLIFLLRGTLKSRHPSNADMKINKFFMPNKVLDKSSDFIRSDIKKISKTEKGIPLSFVNNNGKLTVLLTKSLSHVNIIGSKNHDKTARFIDSFIETASKFKNTPSFVIIDQDGSLYKKHGGLLKALGYKIDYINYNRANQSMRLNPFEPALDIIKKLNAPIQNNLGKYIVNGESFETFPEAEANDKLFKEVLLNECQSYLKSVIRALLPDTNRLQQVNLDVVRNFIIAILIALVDDVSNGVLTESNLCLHNIYNLLYNYMRPDAIVCLKDYFDRHKNNPLINSFVQPLLTASSLDFKLYLSSIKRFLNMLKSEDIRFITSASDFSFMEYDESPHVLFVSYSQEPFQSNLVTVLINQAYFSLNKLSTHNKLFQNSAVEKLTNPCFIIVNDFGSIPALSVFDKNLRTAPAKGIVFVSVVESYETLSNTYGASALPELLDFFRITIIADPTHHESLKSFIPLIKGKPNVDSDEITKEADVIKRIPNAHHPLDDLLSLESILAQSKNLLVCNINQLCFKITLLNNTECSVSNEEINEVLPEVNKNFIFETEPHETSLAFFKNTVSNQSCFNPISQEILSVSKESNMLFDQHMLDCIEKTEKKVKSLKIAKNKSILNIKNFLPDTTLGDKLLNTPSELMPGLIREILESHTDLLLFARLNLATLSALCERIISAENELNDLIANYQIKHPECPKLKTVSYINTMEV